MLTLPDAGVRVLLLALAQRVQGELAEGRRVEARPPGRRHQEHHHEQDQDVRIDFEGSSGLNLVYEG